MSIIIYLVLGASALFVVQSYVFRKRDVIPVLKSYREENTQLCLNCSSTTSRLGYSDPILCYISSIRYMFNAKAIVEEGYRRYPNSAFKIPMLDGWNIVLNGTQYLEELKRTSEEKLSAFESTCDFFQFDHTLGPRLSANRYHFGVIRTVLTRNIEPRFQDIYDAVLGAYKDGIPATGKDWVKVKVFPLHVDIISKVSSRFFVGAPLCESADFRSICETATGEIFKGRALRIFPPPLRPLASKWFFGIHGLKARMEKLLAQTIRHRLEQEKMHGPDWPDKPNDLLTWLIDGARASEEEVTLSDISSRMLFVSFGAIHTSSMTYTAALYELALNPRDADILREEVESVVKEEGWSRESLAKMPKLDSYLRESQRRHAMSLLNIGRTAMTDYVFADNLYIPKGAKIVVNTHGRHYDDEFYPDAHVFNGFRFAKEGGEGQQLGVIPTVEYHAFGIGRPACPGRFFAMVEIKLMMAHVVLNYDIKLETDTYPSSMYIENIILPSSTANVLFRKRSKE